MHTFTPGIRVTLQPSCSGKLIYAEAAKEEFNELMKNGAMWTLSRGDNVQNWKYTCVPFRVV